ncbi:unnamed protein product [Phaeothamnion confervicola]
MTRPGTFQELPFRDAGAGAFETFAAGGGDHAGSALLGCSGSGGGIGAHDAYSDALRRLLEESDAPQGVNVLTDSLGGCCGLSTALLRELREECRSAILCCYVMDTAGGGYPCHSGSGPGGSSVLGGRSGASLARDEARRAVSLALALDALSECATICSVLGEAAAGSVDALAVDPARPYHTSAVLATALDTATAPCRFGGPLSGGGHNEDGGGGGGGTAGFGGSRPMRMAEWAQAAVGGSGGGISGGRLGLADLRLCFPFPAAAADEAALRDLLVASASAPADADWWAAGMPRYLTSLTPAVGAAPRQTGLAAARARAAAAVGAAALPVTASELLVARGLQLAPERQAVVLEEALARTGAPRCRAVVLATPLAVPLSFPAIFRGGTGSGRSGNAYGMGGGGSSSSGCGHGGGAALWESAAVLAAAGTSSSLRPFYAGVLAAFAPERPRVALELEREGMHRDDALEVRERLRALVAECPRGSALGGGGNSGFGSGFGCYGEDDDHSIDDLMDT